MKRLFLAAFLLLCGLAQTFAQTETQSFGKIQISDLQLKECSFEKDANAMVLFDKGNVYFDSQFDIVLETHKRIKIFNEKGSKEADIRIEYYSGSRYEDIFDLSAQTINLKNGQPVITKLEKKQIFHEVIDKNRTAVVFSFPEVQPGSVIEYKYKWKTPAFSNFPGWYFQSKIPVRYSEYTTSIPDILFYKRESRIFLAPAKQKESSESKSLGSGMDAVTYNNKIQTIGYKDIPSLKDEPFMTSRKDNLLRVSFQLTEIRPIGGFTERGADTWQKVAGLLIDDEDFGLQFKKKLDGEDILISKARGLATDDEKIAFLFNEVKNSMKWNGLNNWYTIDGTPKAWSKKTGNSTEINLILFRLLKQSDVKNAYPLCVSTKENGRVNIAFPWARQFNKTVVYIPVDSTKRYFLDASDKFSMYNTIPDELLNSHGLSVDKETKRYNLVEIQSTTPAKKNIFIDANILTSGKMAGTATINDFAYHKINALRTYKADTEEKFKERLSEQNNNVKIKTFNIEAADIDSLPLTEKIEFELDLTASDGIYIFFSPNLFAGLNTNPFISQNRSTLIDFGYNNKYTLGGIFRIPQGYKIDALPKTSSIVMPDRSIIFNRLLAETEGVITVRYVIDFKKSFFNIDEYPMIWNFYKQVYEMLNEQVALKKI